MNGHRRITLFGMLAVLSTLGLGAATLSPAAETQKQPSKGGEEKPGISLRMKDLPKPVQEMVDTIKGVGNRVGDEIPKATGAVTGAVKKAVKPHKEKESR